MINNRQAGRRRGRNNNPRQNGGGNRGNGDSGNRIDSRARGNATQLLEKYRNMARDAQLAGDRVNAEYYLQFADHYFRVLADNRARQEEHQQRFRRNDEGDGDTFDMGYEGDDAAEDGDETFSGDADFQSQPGNGNRDYQNRRYEGRNDDGRERNRDGNRDGGRNRDTRRDDRDAPRAERSERPERSERAERPERTERAGRAERAPRGDRRPRIANDDSEDVGTISLAALPPAIGRGDEGVSEDAAPAEEAVVKPRRGRRPRAPEAAE